MQNISKHETSSTNNEEEEIGWELETPAEETLPIPKDKRHLTAPSARMVCNNCYAAERGCEMARKDADCSYVFSNMYDLYKQNPKSAVSELIISILDLQYDRLQRAAFFEKVGNGQPDPLVSNEVSNILETLKTAKLLSIDFKGGEREKGSLFGDLSKSKKKG